MSSNGHCSESNNRKFPLCQSPCLSLLESHTASINQLAALSRGSEWDCERHRSPTGQEEDGEEAGRRA